jgi:multiple sugar transport system ATP-binding protein
VQQVGEPLELYNKPANRFVAGFLGSPAMNFATVMMTEANGALWAATEGMRIRIPDEAAARLRRYAGEKIVLGIRPEDLRVASGMENGSSFDAVVEVVERLGSETLLDLKAGPCPMVAAVEPNIGAKIRDTLRLAPNPERLHFFDTKTEAAI